MANKYREIQVEENEMETPVTEPLKKSTPPKSPGKPRKKGVLAKALASIFSGTFLANDKNTRHVPFIMYLVVLAIFYIANGYYADDKVRELNKSSNQLKELRSEYISTKSELMFASKQSEVAKAVAQDGLFEPVVPPKKIEVDSMELYPVKHQKLIGK